MDKPIVPVASTASEISNLNRAEVVGIKNEQNWVEGVKRQMDDLKLDHQFNEKDVPQIFQTLINERPRNQKKKLGIVSTRFTEQNCKMYTDDIEVWWKKRNNDWSIRYSNIDTVISTDDPEKSIIDHLWFSLRNPNIKLSQFGIHGHSCSGFISSFPSINHHSQELDFEKMNALLQSMLRTFDHQIQTICFHCQGLNEDTFFSMLQHVKPKILERIDFDISWKEEGNYQKMEEIVETDQWKQAKDILSLGITSLNIDYFFQCEMFWLRFDHITPEDVLRVTEHVFNSTDRQTCRLFSENKDIDIDAIIDFLRLQIDGSQISEDTNPIPLFPLDRFRFKIVKSAKFVLLRSGKNYINIQNHRGL